LRARSRNPAAEASSSPWLWSSRWLPPASGGHSTYSESTDDAQVNGHLIQVSARIAGQVAKVYVDENQVVKAGDTIAELDPADYQVAVENAEAALARPGQRRGGQRECADYHREYRQQSALGRRRCERSQAGVGQAEKQLDSAHARVTEAQANFTKAQADLGALQAAGRKGRHQQQQFDAAVAAADSTKAAVADARANEQAAVDASEGSPGARDPGPGRVEVRRDRPQQGGRAECPRQAGSSQVEQAQAQLDQAKLNLSYTKIVAPEAGIITRKSVEINQNVAPGQNLLMLVSLEGLWVTANFKETAARHMSSGQAVESKWIDRQDLSRQGNSDWRRHRLGALAVSAGKCDGQLREGGAAHPGACRLY